MGCSPLEGTAGWKKYEKSCEGDTTCLRLPGTQMELSHGPDLALG